MTEENKGVFKVQSWDEKATQEMSGGAKITRAAVTQSYEGVISGHGSVEYVMFHRGDGTAIFVGMERIDGSVGGKTGTFVIRHDGTFEDDAARSQWVVIPGSGSGELEGLGGAGSFDAGHGGEGAVTFDPAFGRGA